MTEYMIQRSGQMSKALDWYPEAKDRLPLETLMDIRGRFEEIVFNDSQMDFGCTIQATWEIERGELVWSCDGDEPDLEDLEDFFDSIFYDMVCQVANSLNDEGNESLETTVRSTFRTH